MTALLVALGAGVGAPLRYLLGSRLDTDRFPLGIWLANVLGSFALGVLVGLDVDDPALSLLGTGFCGAFTTYSAFAVVTWERGARGGAAYAALTLGVALPACGAGVWLAPLLS